MATDSLARQWDELKLAPVLREAITGLKWAAPTDVQSAAIPAVLSGKDVAVQAGTGSGKTGAYAVPLAQRVLIDRQHRAKAAGQARKLTPCVALVLVPSVELAGQTVAVLSGVCKYVKPHVSIVNICDRPGGAEPITAATAVDVLVSTPAALAKLLRGGAVDAAVLAGLRMCVIDEADMLVSTTSLAILQQAFPANLQVLLLSATLTDGVLAVQRRLLRNPVSISVKQDDAADGDDADAAVAGDGKPGAETRFRPGHGTLKHRYLVATDEAHHYTLLYSLFRFDLLKGKTLIFVEEEETTYKVQHFLEQLGVACVVYDAKLPANVRVETLRTFDKNDRGVLVCTDGTLEEAERTRPSANQRKKSRAQADEEDGEGEEQGHATALHRGIDFRNVGSVLCFDGLQGHSVSQLTRYVHRAGRTARAGKDGMALCVFTVAQCRAVAPALREHLKPRGEALRAFKDLDRGQAAKLQYRVDTALTNVTRNATRKLRVATVASELSRSQALRSQLAPEDTAALSKVVQRVQHKVKADATLMAVPDYMSLGDEKQAPKGAKRGGKKDGGKSDKKKKARRSGKKDHMAGKKHAKGHVDSVKNFRARVNADDPLSRQRKFERAVARQKAADPLQTVVDKVRKAGGAKKARKVPAAAAKA